MRVWVERQVGLLKDSPGARNFAGTAHEFIDCTDRPAPAIVANRPVHVVIERGSDMQAANAANSAKAAKPDYAVPRMEMIRALPWNGFTAVSTFSGCGGSSLGYRMAGFRVLWASEFVPAARETYLANCSPETIVDGRDIRDVRPEDIFNATGLAEGELDLLDGSPPCANFSTAGKREKAWGKVKRYSDVEQRSDDLFFEFARILRGLQPKTFVAENVSGLVKGTAKGYFLEILAALKACGYRVEARLLDAQWLGVPQARQRLIFVGVRTDLGLVPAFPKPLRYRYSIRDALPWLSGISTSKRIVGGDEPAPTVVTHGNRHTQSEMIAIVAEDSIGQKTRLDLDEPMRTIRAGKEGRDVRIEQSVGARIKHGEAVESHVGASLEGYAVGDEWDKLRPGEQSERFFSLIRPSTEEPVPTITAAGGGGAHSGSPGSTACVVHPTEKRKFSMAELRRLCAFPDDFVLTGTYSQQWERLGRAVPPVMMRHIAEAIRDRILCQTSGKS